MQETNEKDVIVPSMDPSTSHSSDTQAHVHKHAHATLNLEEVARAKGYEKIEPLGAWYLGYKRHDYEGDFATRVHDYSYVLLGQDMKKLEKIELPNGIILYSPGYGGTNSNNIIITHGTLSPLFKKYALFNKDGTYLPLMEETGKAVSGKIVLDKEGNLLLVRKGNGPVGYGEFQGYIASVISEKGIVSVNTIESTELDFANA